MGDADEQVVQHNAITGGVSIDETVSNVSDIFDGLDESRQTN